MPTQPLGYVTIGGDTTPLEKSIADVINKRYAVKLSVDTKGNALGTISKQADQFSESLKAAEARVLAFGAVAGILYTVTGAFKEMLSATLDVEQRLTDINVLLNLSGKELNQFGSSLFTIAKETGQSFTTVSDVAKEFSRQGLNLEDTLKRTAAALVLVRQSGLGAEEAVGAITAAINSFTRETNTAAEITNKFAAVDQAFAVSSRDLAEAVSRVGSTAEDAGVNLNQLLGIVTAVQQTTSRGGAVIGNAFKTIFSRIGNNEAIAKLRELGVEVTNTQTGIQKLQAISKAVELNPEYANEIKRVAGGVLQINVVSAALKDLQNEYGIYAQATKKASEAQNEAFERNARQNETLSANVNKAKQNLVSLAATLGQDLFGPAIKSVTSNFNNIFDNLQSADKGSFIDLGTTVGAGIMKGVGDYISGPGLVLFTAIFGKIAAKFVGYSRKAFSLDTVFSENKQVTPTDKTALEATRVLQQQPDILRSVLNGTLSIQDAERAVLNIMAQQNATLEKQHALITKIATSVALGSPVVPVNTGAKVTKSTPIKRASFGYVPQFAEQAERAGAFAGGYKPGKVKAKNIKGLGKVYYNDAEDIINFPGMDQPAIVPPFNSKAGKNYKKEFEKKLGFDPYKGMGMIPKKDTNKYSYDGSVPNYAVAPKNEIGSGAYGKFYKYKRRPELGYKEIGDKRLIGDEFDSANFAREALKGSPLIDAPKVIGSRERSIKRGGFGKEVINEGDFYKVHSEILKDDFTRERYTESNKLLNKISRVGYSEINDAGISIRDAHLGNIGSRGGLSNFIDKLLKEGKAEEFSNQNFKDIKDQLVKSGIKLSLLDTGFLSKTSPDVNDNFFSNGSIPNFARTPERFGKYAQHIKNKLSQQDIFNSGLSYPDFEAKMKGLYGENYDDHPEFIAKRQQSRKNSNNFESFLQKGILRGLTERYSLPENLQYKVQPHYNTKGSDLDGYGQVAPLPERLFHVTSNYPALKESGNVLKSREELKMAAGIGLGGGADDTISFTNDFKTARGIQRGVVEFSSILSGKRKFSNLIERARTGFRAKKPFLNEFLEYSKSSAGGNIDKIIGENPKYFDDFAGHEGSRNELKSVYNAFSVAQEQAGGYINPLFFMSDYDKIAKLSKKDVKLLEYQPKKKNELGLKLGAGLSEYRVHEGKRFDLANVFAKGLVPNFALPLSIKKKFVNIQKQKGISINRPDLEYLDNIEDAQPSYGHKIITLPRGSSFNTYLHELGHGIAGNSGAEIPNEVNANSSIISKLQQFKAPEQDIKGYRQELNEALKTYKISHLLTKMGNPELDDDTEFEYKIAKQDSILDKDPSSMRKVLSGELRDKIGVYGKGNFKSLIKKLKGDSSFYAQNLGYMSNFNKGLVPNFNRDFQYLDRGAFAKVFKVNDSLVGKVFDPTSDIVKRLGGKDNALKYFNETQEGLEYARNLSIEKDLPVKVARSYKPGSFSFFDRHRRDANAFTEKYGKDVYFQDYIKQDSTLDTKGRENIANTLNKAAEKKKGSRIAGFGDLINNPGNFLGDTIVDLLVKKRAFNKGSIPNFLPTGLLRPIKNSLKRIKSKEYNIYEENDNKLGSAQFGKVNLNKKYFDKSEEVSTLLHENVHLTIQDLYNNASRGNTLLPNELRNSSIFPGINKKFSGSGLVKQIDKGYDRLDNGPKNRLDNLFQSESYSKDQLLEESIANGTNYKGILNPKNDAVAKGVGLTNKQITRLQKIYSRLYRASGESLLSSGIDIADKGLVPNYANSPANIKKYFLKNSIFENYQGLQEVLPGSYSQYKDIYRKTELGAGAYGKFERYDRQFSGKTLGIKTFNDQGGEAMKKATEEYINSKVFKYAIDTGLVSGALETPDVIGKPKKRRGEVTLGKEVIKNAPFIDKYNESSHPTSSNLRSGYRILQKSLSVDNMGYSGVGIEDAHFGNVSVNDKGIDFLNRTGSKLSKLGLKKADPSKYLKAFEKFGGKLNIFDTGNFFPTDDFVAKAKKAGYLNGGLVPNYAFNPTGNFKYQQTNGLISSAARIKEAGLDLPGYNIKTLYGGENSSLKGRYNPIDKFRKAPLIELFSQADQNTNRHEYGHFIDNTMGLVQSGGESRFFSDLNKDKFTRKLGQDYHNSPKEYFADIFASLTSPLRKSEGVINKDLSLNKDSSFVEDNVKGFLEKYKKGDFGSFDEILKKFHGQYNLVSSPGKIQATSSGNPFGVSGFNTLSQGMTPKRKVPNYAEAFRMMGHNYDIERILKDISSKKLSLSSKNVNIKQYAEQVLGLDRSKHNLDNAENIRGSFLVGLNGPHLKNITEERLKEPGLLTDLTVGKGKQKQTFGLVIDGNHRLAKSYLSGIDELPFNYFDEKTSKKYRSANGLIPNYKNLVEYSPAVKEAIAREQEAGLPLSQIRVGKDSRIKSKDNPQGLGVYNKLDEPAGIKQGVSRAIKERRDPKKYGIKASGFVPNFAPESSGFNFSNSGFLKDDINSIKQAFKAGTASQKDLNAIIGQLTKTYQLTQSEIKKYTSNLAKSAEFFKQPKGPTSFRGSVKFGQEKESAPAPEKSEGSALSASELIGKKFGIAGKTEKAPAKNTALKSFKDIANIESKKLEQADKVFDEYLKVGKQYNTERIKASKQEADKIIGSRTRGTFKPKQTPQILESLPIVEPSESVSFGPKGRSIKGKFKIRPEVNILESAPNLNSAAEGTLLSSREKVSEKLFEKDSAGLNSTLQKFGQKTQTANVNASLNLSDNNAKKAIQDAFTAALKNTVSPKDQRAQTAASTFNFANKSPQTSPLNASQILADSQSKALRNIDQLYEDALITSGVAPLKSSKSSTAPRNPVISLKNNNQDRLDREKALAAASKIIPDGESDPFAAYRLAKSPFGNFQGPIGSSSKQLINSVDKYNSRPSRITRFANNLGGGAGIGASIALPIVSGIAQEFIGDETLGKRRASSAIGGLANVGSFALTGAGIGAAFGGVGAPVGAAIGTAVGLITSITSATKEWNNTLPELDAQLVALANSSSRTTAGIQTFINATEKLAAIRSGDVNADPKDVKRLEDIRNRGIEGAGLSNLELEALLKNPTSKNASDLLARKTESSNEETETVNTKKTFQTLRNNPSDFFNSKGFFGSNISSFFTGSIGVGAANAAAGGVAANSVSSVFKKGSEEELKHAFSSILNTGVKGTSQEESIRTLKEQETGVKTQREEFGSFFEKNFQSQFDQAKPGVEQFDVFTKALESANLKFPELKNIRDKFTSGGQALPELKLIVNALKDSLKSNQASEPIGQAIDKSTKRQSFDVDIASSILESIQTNFNDALNRAIVDNEINLKNVEGQAQIGKTKRDSDLSLQTKFLSESSLAANRFNNALIEINSSFDQLDGKNVADTVLKVKASLESISSKLVDDSRRISTKSDVTDVERPALLNQASTIATGFRSTFENIKKPEDIAKTLETLRTSLGENQRILGGEEVTGAKRDLLRAEQKSLQEAILKINKVNDEHDKTNAALGIQRNIQQEILSIQEQETRALIEQKKTLSSFGGLGGTSRVTAGSGEIFNLQKDLETSKQVGDIDGQTEAINRIADIYSNLGLELPGKIRSELEKIEFKAIELQVDQGLRPKISEPEARLLSGNRVEEKFKPGQGTPLPGGRELSQTPTLNFDVRKQIESQSSGFSNIVAQEEAIKDLKIIQVKLNKEILADQIDLSEAQNVYATEQEKILSVQKQFSETLVVLKSAANYTRDQAELFETVAEREEFINKAEETRIGYQRKINLGIEDGLKAQRAYTYELAKQTSLQAELAFNTGKVGSETLKIANATKRIAELNDSGKLKASSIGEAFGDQFKNNNIDNFKALNDAAVDFGQEFKSGIKGAFAEFQDGTKSAKEALADLGLSLARSLGQKAFNIGVDNILGQTLGSLKFAKGGQVRGFSSGGEVTGGSGTKDDVPALLTDGEYVINKGAAKRYGIDFLENINEKRVSYDGETTAVNSGSKSFNSVFQNTLKLDDPINPTKGTLLTDPNLSSFALEDENNPQNVARYKREDLLAQYIRNNKKLLEDYKKKKNNALNAALIQAGISIVGIGVGAASGGFKGKTGTASTSVPGATGNTLNSSPYQTGLNYNQSGIGGGTTFNPSVPVSQSGYGSYTNFNYDQLGRHAKGGKIKKYARGGNVFGGDSYSDRIPALLTDGEFVITKEASQKYGTEFLEKLNSQKITKLADGGPVSSQYAGTSSSGLPIEDLVDSLAALKKTMEGLIEKTSTKSETKVTNNDSAPQFNIVINNTINQDKNGQVTSNSSSSASSKNDDNGKNTSKEESQKNADGLKALSDKMAAVARKTILEEMRPNGFLENVNRR